MGETQETRASGEETNEGIGVEAQRRQHWLARVKLPLWLSLLLMLVVALFAFFISYPERTVSSALERTFSGTDQVKITYCLSNEAARDPDRWKAEERLRRELEQLGVRNVEISFVSPCPASAPAVGGPQPSPTTPLPPA